MSMRAGLGACGVGIIAAILAGCSSGGSPAGALAGTPSWAKTLGTGVTLTGPGSSSAGDGSPGGAILSAVIDMQTGQYSKLCNFYEPSEQSQCSSEIGSVSSSALASHLPTFKNFNVGYTAFDGTEALVGETGTICTPDQSPECQSNTDPAALLNSGESFAALWSEAINSSGNGYSLTPMIKINGAWYAYLSGGL